MALTKRIQDKFNIVGNTGKTLSALKDLTDDNKSKSEALKDLAINGVKTTLNVVELTPTPVGKVVAVATTTTGISTDDIVDGVCNYFKDDKENKKSDNLDNNVEEENTNIKTIQ